MITGLFLFQEPRVCYYLKLSEIIIIIIRLHAVLSSSLNYVFTLTPTCNTLPPKKQGLTADIISLLKRQKIKILIKLNELQKHFNKGSR